MSGAISWLGVPSRTELCFHGGSVLFAVCSVSLCAVTGTCGCTQGVYRVYTGCYTPLLPKETVFYTAFTPLLRLFYTVLRRFSPFYAVSHRTHSFLTARTLFSAHALFLLFYVLFISFKAWLLGRYLKEINKNINNK